MTFIFWILVGAIGKTLLPMPAMDDKVRELWRWGWGKIR